MAIPFNQVPASIRVPFVYVEFDNSRAAGNSAAPFRILALGQKLAAGTATAGVLGTVGSFAEARGLFGAGSQLAGIVETIKQNNSFTPVDYIALDDAAGVAASGTVTITGTSTAAGTLALIVGGRAVSVAVSSGASATAIATALAAEIQDSKNADLPVSATSSAGVVTLTAKNKGEAGNEIGVFVNYWDGQATPAGITVAVSNSGFLQNGATNPDIATAIAAMGDNYYQVIVLPWVDSANLAKVKTEAERRWGPLVQAGGVWFAAANRAHSGLTTLGNAQNNQWLCVSGIKSSPSTPWQIAAAVAAQVAVSAENDPAQPFQTLPLQTILPPVRANRFTVSELNTLLYSGISTLLVDSGGTVRIQRLITTYKTNGLGAIDTSYLDTNTIFTLEFLRQDFRNYILGKYARAKLASDGAQFGTGQVVITPKIGKAEAITKFKEWESRGLVENFEQFKNDLVCERNASDPTRLDWLMSPDLMNQFVVGAANIRFLR